MFDPPPRRLRSNSSPHRPRTAPTPQTQQHPALPPNPSKSTHSPLTNRAPSPIAEPPLPPRPPRNPARAVPPFHFNLHVRPSTASDSHDRKPFWDLSSPSTSKHIIAHTQSTEFSLLKRNKSAGSKISRFRSNTQPVISDDPQTPINPLPETPVHRPSENVLSPSPQPPSRKQKELQFSTADRTILEELRRNISAHEAQFVMKGSGIRHHPYSPDVVPYPRSYVRDAVDMDVWETAFCQQICASLTFHVFDVPPTKVLDIGCGTGTWILDCARTWRSCHFVGLDIVPLHPDLQRVGSLELASRITWVQANFLEGLPFPNEEFDFVHIKRIARGVPEDKWDPLLEEITRVMKPGGAFEMIEEDLFFPGSYEYEDGEFGPPSPNVPTFSEPSITETSEPAPILVVFPKSSNRPSSPSSPHSPSTRPINVVVLPGEDVRRKTKDSKQQHRLSRQYVWSPQHSPLSESGRSPSSPFPRRHEDGLSTHRLLERIYTEMHESRFINLSPLSLLANSLRLYFKDVRTHPPLQVTFPPRKDRGKTAATAAKRHSMHDGWVSVQGLLDGSCRHSPSDEEGWRAMKMAMLSSRLPNRRMEFDLGTLNLHLALRTSEILACGEAMWEWVVEYQKKEEKTRDGELLAIGGMRRDEFDKLLGKFERDMRGCMGLGSVLEERFLWGNLRLPGSGDEEITEGMMNDDRKGQRMGRSLRVFAAWKDHML